MMGDAAAESGRAPLDVVDALLADWRVERPDLDVRAMAVIGRILMIGQKLHQRVGGVLSEFDLNYSDFDVLATLRRSGEPYELAPTQLMRSVLITSGAMTALLDRLTARGFIERGQNRRDGRVRTAILTAEGRALVDRAAQVRFAEASQAAACFSSGEQAAMSTSLKRLNHWLDELADADRP